MNYGPLFRSALVALLRNKMRSILTVLGITVDRVGNLRVDEVQVARSLVSAWCAADWLLIRWNVRTTLASAGRT